MSLSHYTVACGAAPKIKLPAPTGVGPGADASAIHGRLGAQVALLQSPILPAVTLPYSQIFDSCNPPVDKPHTRCLRLSRGRFPVEQFFQRGKTDLGLDHYEGRSWQGFHHHLVLAAVAYLFVTVIYLRSKKNFWCYVGTGVARDAAVVGAADRLRSVLRDGVRAENLRFNITE